MFLAFLDKNAGNGTRKRREKENKERGNKENGR
jgi:hypothetical protein